MNKKSLIAKLICRYAKDNNFFYELKKLITYDDINKIIRYGLSTSNFNFLDGFIREYENGTIGEYEKRITLADVDILYKLNEVEFVKICKLIAIDIIKSYFKQNDNVYKLFINNVNKGDYISFDNYVEAYLSTSINLASFIIRPFTWNDTEEGYAFWFNISRKINKLIAQYLLNEN